MYSQIVLTLTQFSRVFGDADINCGKGVTGAVRDGQKANDALSCQTGLPNVAAGGAEIQQILAIVFGIIAALTVLMIVISGLRFITADGNPQEIAKARNTIIYSLIGLVVSLTAEAIVALVLGKL